MHRLGSVPEMHIGCVTTLIYEKSTGNLKEVRALKL